MGSVMFFKYFSKAVGSGAPESLSFFAGELYRAFCAAWLDVVSDTVHSLASVVVHDLLAHP